MITGIPSKQAILRLCNGAVEFTDLENLIVLHMNMATISKFSTLRKDFAAAGYQVTAGKTLYLLAAKLCVASAAGTQGQTMQIGYGDTDVGFTGAAAPTNPKYYGGSASASMLTSAMPTTGNPPNQESAIFMPVPAAKYVFCAVDGGAAWGAQTTLSLFGYER